jgi:hypothetical protein
MSDNETPLPRTDLPEFTEEEMKEIKSRTRNGRDGIPVTLEEALRFPKGSLSNWRLLPRE